jgi:hypothetical protein
VGEKTVEAIAEGRVGKARERERRREGAERKRERKRGQRRGRAVQRVSDRGEVKGLPRKVVNVKEE